jgi:hypothetical protein
MEAFQWREKNKQIREVGARLPSTRQHKSRICQKLLTSTLLKEANGEEDQLYPFDHLSILLDHDLLPWVSKICCPA